MIEHMYLVPLLPFLGFVFTAAVGRRIGNEKIVGWISSLSVGASFVIAAGSFVQMLGMPAEDRKHFIRLFEWFSAGHFSVDVAYQVDQLSMLFTLIITGVGFLIHIYSIGYMHGDKSFSRFFAYLNLFVFMMLNLVLADNFLLTFLGWEGVGLSSYLLIGFWYDRKFEGTNIVWTGDAAKKAFIVNRIGDFGMLVAMFIIYLTTNTLRYDDVNSAAMANAFSAPLITLVTLSIFLGCTGKSAQIPLGVWLPDAMAGPTPVSALIHAATMVTSGIFLIARTAPLFAHAPTTMAVIVAVGITTALVAGTIGVVQNDIKKVLAYSTVSQLGLMFVALGLGGWVAGVFHVMTHAFFKALLFLGSGSVIHGMHDEQDIQKMGGLKKYMPITHLTFFIGTLAISGVPFLAGFFSKDEILWNSWLFGSPILWGVGVLAAFTTAFYMFRLHYLTFHGEERFDHHHVHPHESPSTMTIPLMVLAVLSVFGGLLGVPYALGSIFHMPNYLEHWLEPVFAQANEALHRSQVHEVHTIEYILMAVSVAIALVAIFFARAIFRNRKASDAEATLKLGPAFKILWNKYYIDEIYQVGIVETFYKTSRDGLWRIFDVMIVDGVVNGSARLVGGTGEIIRKIQSGVAQNYAVLMLVGIVAIVGYMLVDVHPLLRLLTKH